MVASRGPDDGWLKNIGFHHQGGIVTTSNKTYVASCYGNVKL